VEPEQLRQLLDLLLIMQEVAVVLPAVAEPQEDLAA
jgi:hypothetical protein